MVSHAGTMVGQYAGLNNTAMMSRGMSQGWIPIENRGNKGPSVTIKPSVVHRNCVMSTRRDNGAWTVRTYQIKPSSARNLCTGQKLLASPCYALPLRIWGAVCVGKSAMIMTMVT